MEKAYKYRLYPNEAQKKLIIKTFGCVRYVYNYFLNLRITEYEQKKSYPSYYDCMKKLTQLKQELSWLKEPDKCSLQNGVKALDQAYKNFFRNKRFGFPHFKSKKNKYQSYKTTNILNNIKYLGRKVQLPKIGRIKISKGPIPEGRILNATISMDPDNRFYVSICCTDVNIEEIPKSNKNIGIDLGITSLITTSEGNKFENPKFLYKVKKRLAFYQRSLSRKAKGSKRREKLRIKIAKINKHISNQRQDYLHKITKFLICNYDLIAVENLSIQNMEKLHTIAGHIQDASWSEFLRQLNYKSKWYGKKVISVDTFYPSSQLCSECGYQNPKIKDCTIRAWTCPICGTFHDRDINAAINILSKGLCIANPR